MEISSELATPYVVVPLSMVNEGSSLSPVSKSVTSKPNSLDPALAPVFHLVIKKVFDHETDVACLFTHAEGDIDLAVYDYLKIRR